MSTRRGEGLSAAERLRRRADFLRCYRRGRRRHGEMLVLHFAPNGRGAPRLGITANRKVGGAVVRHRLKRRVREIYRRWPGRSGLLELDILVHLHPRAAGSSFADFRADLEGALSGLPQRTGGEKAP